MSRHITTRIVLRSSSVFMPFPQNQAGRLIRPDLRHLYWRHSVSAARRLPLCSKQAIIARPRASDTKSDTIRGPMRIISKLALAAAATCAFAVPAMTQDAEVDQAELARIMKEHPAWAVWLSDPA